MEYALRFGFQASNNEVEYEAFIVGLNLTHSMEADQLEVCSDSQLVVKQIENSYKVRAEKMIIYLKKVRELFKKFIRVQVRHVPRAENSRADALAKLATASREDLDRLVPVEHLPEPSVNVDNEITWWMEYFQPIQRRPPSSGRGQLDSPFIEGPFINEAFLHPSLSA